MYFTHFRISSTSYQAYSYCWQDVGKVYKCRLFIAASFPSLSTSSLCPSSPCLYVWGLWRPQNSHPSFSTVTTLPNSSFSATFRPKDRHIAALAGPEKDYVSKWVWKDCLDRNSGFWIPRWWSRMRRPFSLPLYILGKGSPSSHV